MSYAAKHGYEELCQEAAPHTLSTDAADAFEHMGPACFASWVSTLQSLLTTPIIMAPAHSYGPGPLS